MASLAETRRKIEALLTEYTHTRPYNAEDVRYQTVFDHEQDRYLLLAMGWQDDIRVHDVVLHFDIIDGKVWLQVNNTDQLVAEELVKAGVPRANIVLGLQPPELRPYTDYAVA